MGDDTFARADRRLAALENARPAALRFGEVVGVDEADGSVRVRVKDAGGVTTKPLRTLQPRSLRDQHQELPDIGEQVACLVSGQGAEEGVILGAICNKQVAAPGRPPQNWYRRFADGTEIEYDRAAHKLRLAVQGDIEISATGEIKINAAHIRMQE